MTASDGEARSGEPAQPPDGSPPRLLAELDRLLRGRIAVVCAPAGYGKNDLVSAWLQRHPDLVVQRPGSLQDLAGLRERTGDASPQPLTVLLVDRPELLADEAFVAQALDRAEADPGLRVLFVGRVRPEGPLGSLAARGRLVDIGADQLAWTRREMAAALTPRTPRLDAAALDTVMAGTRGWPAIGRMLAAEPLSWAQTSRIIRLADSYIHQEVLDGLAADDLDLLLQLSALPSLEPLSAAWLTGRGDAAAQLSRLQASGVPISWDDANTIRLNPMVRGYLERRLLQQDPQRSRQLRQRAALWLRNRDRRLEAIQLAMQGEMVDLAWMLAAEFVVTMLHRPELSERLAQLSGEMPPGWDLDVFRTLSRGIASPDSMLSMLDALDPEQMFQCGDTGRLGYASFVLGTARRMDYPEVDLTLALEIAAGADSHAVHELDLALLCSLRTEYGLWLMHQARVLEAQPVLLNALGLARVVGVPWAVVAALGALALIAAEQGRVEAAHRLAEEAVQTGSETVFQTDALTETALLAQALAAVDVADLPAARRLLAQLDRHQEHLAENDAIRVYVEGSLRLAEDDPQAALQLVGAYRDQPRSRPADLHRLGVGIVAFNAAVELGELERAQREVDELRQVGHADLRAATVYFDARLALATGDAARAHRLLQPLIASSGLPVENGKRSLYVMITFATAAAQLQRPDEARQVFQRAGALAERLGLNLPGARHTRAASASRKELPLTAAERKVLAELDPTRTLGQSAEALFISVNTLKTHLRRIYRKLGVANREEALERARLLGLVTPREHNGR